MTSSGNHEFLAYGPVQIYHEYQESALCARHCLNNLLQGPYYTEVDLSQIALEFDRREKELIASTSGVNSVEYLKWLQDNETSNVSQDGNFSVQVLQTALQTFNLNLNRLKKQDITNNMLQPESVEGFIINHNAHWFSLRKIDGKWYDLNSLSGYPETKSEPTSISDFYLSSHLLALMESGFSVFTIVGTFPGRGSLGDMSVNDFARYFDPVKVKTKAEYKAANAHKLSSGLGLQSEEAQIRMAMEASMAGGNSGFGSSGFGMGMGMSGDAQLQQAIAMSMSDNNNFGISGMGMENNEDLELQRAINLSMQMEQNDDNNNENKAVAKPVVDVQNENNEVAEESDMLTEDVETMMGVALSMLPDEPNKDHQDALRFQITLPDGKKLSRYFLKENSFGDIYNFVKSESINCINNDFCLVGPEKTHEDEAETLQEIPNRTLFRVKLKSAEAEMATN